jgi:hypothetical protein
MGGNMKRLRNRQPLVSAVLVAVSCAVMVGFGGKGDDGDRQGGPVPLTVPKARCGPNDHPETALQGQVPAALRAAGFHGFNCNLELIGQSRGDGANWQTTEFRSRAHGRTGEGEGEKRGQRADVVCAYHGTASPALSGPGRAALGVPVIDVTNAGNPTPTAHLSTSSMLDPWESLKVNERRQLLSADNGQNGGGGSEVDLYDLSDDCRFPQLLASAPVGTGRDGGVKLPFVPIGHEGSISDDGLTYYIGDTTNRSYHAVDISNPREPKMIATFDMKTIGLASHGLSISEDGNRAYVVTPSIPAAGDLTDPTKPATNGFVILDTSEVQARKANPQMKVVGKFLFKDGSVAQHTIPVKIRGRSYVIHVDEGGSGGIFLAGWQAACSAGLPLFPMPRIVDISDEKNPREVSKVMLETHDPKNCGAVLPDLAGLSIFTYGSHYCSVDNKRNATTLACGFFNSGIRVFDIRDPVRPKEIAYFNPAGVSSVSPGSNHALGGNFRADGPDWCSAQVHLDAERGTLWSTCQDNGLVMLKFRKGVWPFEQSSTPAGMQN